MKDTLLFFGVIITMALLIGHCRRQTKIMRQLDQSTGQDTLIRRAGKIIFPPQPFTFNSKPGTLYYVFVPEE